MTKLPQLRRNLAALRRRRQAARWLTAGSGLAAAALWILVAAFVVDFATESGIVARLVILAAVAAALAWAARRYAVPWLLQRESDLEMALLLERQHRISNDLVAALQFETPEAASWGSPQLEQAVIDRVAKYANRLDVFAHFSVEVLQRRAAVLAATLLLVGAAIVWQPDYARVFFNRLLLGYLHYPTDTLIDEILVNGTQVDLWPGRRSVVKCAQGQAVAMQVLARQSLPRQGEAVLIAPGNRRITLDLLPVPPVAQLAQLTEATYQGQLERLSEPARFQVFLGDAWTDPAEIELIPLPVVDLNLVVTPPDYAHAQAAAADDQPGRRTIDVVEGSRVAIQLDCRNKPLQKAVLYLDDVPYPLVRRQPQATATAPGASSRAAASEPADRWSFDPQGTPLARVAQQIRYRVEAVDADGLAPGLSLEGYIRIQTDRPPHISGSMRTRYVLPSGGPTIEYRVTDDYGVAGLLVRATVLRDSASDPAPIEHPPIPVFRQSRPALAPELPLKGSFVFELAQLNLLKGDRVQVALEAVDYRGELPGRSSLTDSITLYVTDTAGIEAAVTELDPALEQQFNTLIQRQLDIGASR